MTCDYQAEHSAIVKLAKENMPSEEFLSVMCEMLKMLSEPSRMKIVLSLMQGEMCVQHIVEAVEGNQSAVSQQLRILKNCKIIKCRRDGKNILYTIADEHVEKIVKMSMEHATCEIK